MTDTQKPETKDVSILDIGRPVEWMLNPVTRDVLGVTYVFTQSSERRTVWYTANKRKPKDSLTVTNLSDVPA